MAKIGYNKAAVPIKATDIGSNPDIAALTYLLFLNFTKKSYDKKSI